MNKIQSKLTEIKTNEQQKLLEKLNNTKFATYLIALVTPISDICKSAALKQVAPTFSSTTDRGSSIPLPANIHIGQKIESWDNLHFANKKKRKQTYDLYMHFMEQEGYDSNTGRCPQLERESALLDCEDKLISELTKYTGVSMSDLKNNTMRYEYLNGCKKVLLNNTKTPLAA
ncbi:hypothetical protein [Pseudoalteromonas marina]|uniref:Uncharacterized protein n=1 Tax=Pseudoalteromonas marina TaxID=267375 RepID=A0ABT9FG69_9GAMM|nr:hypothetical protein [Pseudoalteromonas marina]MDP2565782.1 hypothetical protein [Pseudoalteromonas marina]